MLNVKFRKTAESVYISHIDVQNAVNRTVKRAGYEPSLSAGFNPHTLLKMSAPLPLGIKSEAEYFTLYLDGVAPDEFTAAFNANAPHGLEAVFTLESKINPNIAGLAAASDYLIRDPRLCGLNDRIAAQIAAGFVIRHKNKDGETEEKTVSDLIYSAKTSEEGLRVRLASGNLTLRPDRFAEALNGYFGLDIKLRSIIRTAQYVKTPEGLKDADIYLASLTFLR